MFINEHIGFGIVATERIPRGTVVWALDDLDQRISEARAAAVTGPALEMMVRYSYFDSTGERILCWDHAKYMNHHCEATCLSPGLRLEIAVRDVEAGEQLTDDYGSLNLEEPFQCACESPRCRGVVRPGDFETLSKAWDERLRAAMADVPNVPQPLWDCVYPEDAAALLGASAAPTDMLSIRRHFLRRRAA